MSRTEPVARAACRAHNHGSVGTDIWITRAWLVGILIVAYTFAIATYRRKIS